MVITPTHYLQLEISGLGVKLSGRGSVKKIFFLFYKGKFLLNFSFTNAYFLFQ